MATVELTRDNFDETIQNNDFVIVDFWAQWCAPCKNFAPVYEKVSEHNKNLVFGKVDTESQSDLASHFHIRSIPTLLVFRNQIIIFRVDQSLPEDALVKLIDKAGSLDMKQIQNDALQNQ